MSNLSKEWNKLPPFVQNLLREMLLAIVHGATPEQRQQFAAHVADIDANGNGIPDALETEAETKPAPRKRKAG